MREHVLMARDTNAMENLGCALADCLHAGDLLSLSGPLGAGKTTLTRGMAAGLGVQGLVTSPTFVIARTHTHPRGGPPLVHVDAYRLGGPAALEDLDIDFEGSVVVVEWGAGMLEWVSASRLDIHIDRGDARGHFADRDVSEGDQGNGPRPAADDIDVRNSDFFDWDSSGARLVRIVPFGPRWDRPAFDALLEHLESIG